MKINWPTLFSKNKENSVKTQFASFSFALFIYFFIFSHKFFKTNKIIMFCISHLGFIIKDWPYYLYITCLCTLFSLDEFLLLHFTNLSFVVHVVWEMFLVLITLFWSWSHMSLTVGLELFEKCINNHLTSVH